ncbi:MAG: class I SAM-dependent methyltransferase, partial [Chloroflexaceae bacterium]
MIASSIRKTVTERIINEAKILVYQLRGRVPGSKGYRSYRERYVQRTVASPQLMAAFRAAAPLPCGFGVRLDERVVEYPWTFARLERGPRRLLDAGAALNHRFLLRQPALVERTIVIYTLGPSRYERVFVQPNISYVYGDLRETILRDGSFDEAVCISTLEHVGMDNTRFYTSDARFREHRQRDYLRVVHELARLLRPDGRLLLTVPFGRNQQLDWLQQFNTPMLDELVAEFGGVQRERSFYRYTHEGWQIASADDCRDCEYFDMHAHKQPASDFA